MLADLPIAACVLLQRGGRFAAIRSKKNAHRGNGVEIPGGKGRPGESAEQAALREALEEIGVLLDRVVLLCEFEIDGLHGHLFVGIVDDPNPALVSSDEGEAFWATRDELNAGTYGLFTRRWFPMYDHHWTKWDR